jgi:histidinol-phosphate phosphatase family protein
MRLRRAAASDLALVIITNQSGVARGYFSADTLTAIHDLLTSELRATGVVPDGIYACIHHPDDACQCRKPLPGMLLRAAEDLDLDLAQSWMIGDRWSDLEAGKRAGCRTALVLTGYGRETLREGVQPDLVVEDLAEAVERILSLDGQSS